MTVVLATLSAQDLADYVQALVVVYTLLIIAYILSSLFFAFGGRLPYCALVERGARLPARRLRALPGDLPALHPAARPAGPEPDHRDHRCCSSSAALVARPHRRLSGVARALAFAPRGAWSLVIVARPGDQGARARRASRSGDRDARLPGRRASSTCATTASPSARFSGGGTIVAVIVVAPRWSALVAYFATHLDSRWSGCRPGMLLGGAIGNVIDRIRDGAVTDFIKLPAWPAFNVADIVDHLRRRSCCSTSSSARAMQRERRLRTPGRGSTRSSPARSARARAPSG